jgi:hypothetical protein
VGFGMPFYENNIMQFFKNIFLEMRLFNFIKCSAFFTKLNVQIQGVLNGS